MPLLDATAISSILSLLRSTSVVSRTCPAPVEKVFFAKNVPSPFPMNTDISEFR